MISLFNEDIMAMRVYTRVVKPAENEFITYPDTIWKKILVLYEEKTPNFKDTVFSIIEYEFENDNHTVYENRTKLENLTDYRDKCNNALDDGFREIGVRALQDELAEWYYGKEPEEWRCGNEPKE